MEFPPDNGTPAAPPFGNSFLFSDGTLTDGPLGDPDLGLAGGILASCEAQATIATTQAGIATAQAALALAALDDADIDVTEATAQADAAANSATVALTASSVSTAQAAAAAASAAAAAGSVTSTALIRDQALADRIAAENAAATAAYQAGLAVGTASSINTVIGTASVTISIRAWGCVTDDGLPGQHMSNGTFNWQVDRIPWSKRFYANAANDSGYVMGAYVITITGGCTRFVPVVTLWAPENVYQQDQISFAMLARNIVGADNGLSGTPPDHKDSAGLYLMLNNLSIRDWDVLGTPNVTNNRLESVTVPGGNITDIMLGDRISGPGLQGDYGGTSGVNNGSMLVSGIDSANGYVYGSIPSSGPMSGVHDVGANTGAGTFVRHNFPANSPPLKFTVFTGRTIHGAETHNVPINRAFSFLILGED